MALKKKGAPAEESVPVAKAKPKAKAKAPAVELTPAQKVAAALKKDQKALFNADVIFDPDEPLARANKWIRMPHPWNQLCGVIGVPFGHVTTIQGKPDSGKTTVAMHSMVEAQEQGFEVALIDTEHKFNFTRFVEMGGDMTRLLVLKCQTIEDGFDAIDRTILLYDKVSKGTPILFVWDSLGMTPTDEEMKKDARGITVASAAKIIKRNLRRQMMKIASRDVAILFINQLYDNINALFGNSTKGYGGNGAYFASVLVFEVQRIRNKTRTVNKKQEVVGLVSGIKCTKNHLSSVQGGKCEVLIGPKGLQQDSVKELDSEELESLAGDDDDDIQPGVPKKKGQAVDIDDDEMDDDLDTPKMRNGREASL